MSIEQRFAVERGKVAGFGPFKGLCEYGQGIVLFWTSRSEWWGPPNYWKS